MNRMRILISVQIIRETDTEAALGQVHPKLIIHDGAALILLTLRDNIIRRVFFHFSIEEDYILSVRIHT